MARSMNKFSFGRLKNLLGFTTTGTTAAADGFGGGERGGKVGGATGGETGGATTFGFGECAMTLDEGEEVALKSTAAGGVLGVD